MSFPHCGHRFFAGSSPLPMTSVLKRCMSERCALWVFSASRRNDVHPWGTWGGWWGGFAAPPTIALPAMLVIPNVKQRNPTNHCPPRDAGHSECEAEEPHYKCHYRIVATPFLGGAENSG
jgi:hypothetical protein